MPTWSRREWPDVPRLAFGEGPDRRFNADVRWVQSSKDLEIYGLSYRQAAEAYFEWVAKARPNPTYMLWPLAFLWRHHIELSLKSIISLGWKLEGQRRGFPEGHGLLRLWREAKPYIERTGPEDSSELVNVEQNIMEFDRIDPGSTGFRYPVASGGQLASLVDPPDVVNLRSFHEAMLAVSNFFGAVWSVLDEARSAMPTDY